MLTNHFVRIENTSTNLLNSNLKEMSVKLTPNFENMSVNSKSYIEKTNVSFNETTPFPPITDPLSKSLAPLFENRESKLHLHGTPSSVGPSGILFTSNRRIKNYIIEEDFKRIRPIYNDFNKFNDDRYKGFRLGCKLIQLN